MYKINKFQIFTVVFICLFIFAVAAMYTNTKEATERKQGMVQPNSTRYEREIRRNDNIVVQDNSDDIRELNSRIEIMSQRIDELSSRRNDYTQQQDNSGLMKCQIEGIIGDRGFEQLSQGAAIDEARENDREIVMTCRLK